MRVGLLGAMIFLIAVAIAFWLWHAFDTRAHFIAAITMFAFLAAAASGTAREHRRDQASQTYFRLYTAIASLMVGSAFVIFVMRFTWNHRVLVLEGTEITLFAAFWLVQTAEHWNETVGVSGSGGD